MTYYAARRAIEEGALARPRDWHHSRGLREAATALTDETVVVWTVGIACLADQRHVELGVRFSRDLQGQARRARWTATDRPGSFPYV